MKASCDQEVLAQSLSLIVLEYQLVVFDDGLIKKEQAKALAKKTKLEEKEKLKEGKKKERELEREIKKKEAKERRQLGMKVKKLGLKKVLEDKGISPSGSSKPTSSTAMPIVCTPSLLLTPALILLIFSLSTRAMISF